MDEWTTPNVPSRATPAVILASGERVSAPEHRAAAVEGDGVYIGEGFPGQSLRVLSRSVVAHYLSREPTSRLMVTDAGFFPHASHHGRARPRGIPQAVVLLCTAGSGRLQLAAGEHRVRTHELAVLPPHEPHSYFADDDDPWTILWFHVAGANLAEVLAAIGLTADEPLTALREPWVMAGLADEVVAHLSHDETPGSILAASGAAWHLLMSVPRQRRRRSGPVDRVQRVQAAIREDLSRPIDRAGLAAQMGISEGHLAALFRQETGTGMLEYQISLRMARARELLLLGDLPISEVARSVGYDDALYFSRVFRARTDVSPSDYRRRQGQHPE